MSPKNARKVSFKNDLINETHALEGVFVREIIRFGKLVWWHDMEKFRRNTFRYYLFLLWMVSYSEYSTMFVYFGNSRHVGERLWSLHGCFAGVGGHAAGKLRARWWGGHPSPKVRAFCGWPDSGKFWDRLLPILPGNSCNQSHALSCNSLFSGQRSTLGNGLSGGPCQSFINS